MWLVIVMEVRRGWSREVVRVGHVLILLRVLTVLVVVGSDGEVTPFKKLFASK